jgi:signal transduction histidine kinase
MEQAKMKKLMQSENPVLSALLIEDNDDDVGLISEMLADAPGVRFELTCTDRVGKACAHLRKNKFDIILMDLGLPDSDGIESFRKIHAQVEATPIVVFTICDDETKGINAVREGAQDYLVKGKVDGELLVRSICYAIERKRSEMEIRAYAEKLEKANEELQEFAFVASHDLQEPLRKVQAFGERLKLKYEASLGEDGRDFLERMQKAASRMETLIQDLLKYSRVATRTKPFVRLNLLEPIKQALSNLERSVEETGGRLVIEDLPSIDMDKGQMCQLFQNIIGNALKYHRPEEHPIIKIYPAPCDRGLCCIAVEDNGIGFDEKHAERIFRPFQRLHGRSSYEGTGMGLAICRRIAERHGGSITVNSTIGKGSVFTVILPVSQPRIERAEEITAGS